MASRDSLGRRAGFRRLHPHDRQARREDTEPAELEPYRFWHLDYGEVAYYDQLVFKRHAPIPPRTTRAAEGKG